MGATATRADVYSRVTAKIVADLERGVRPWLKPWNMEHAAGWITRPLRANGRAYKGINVLESSELRSGIKEFFNWPTIPQLYVKGEFVGGCDIVREMFQSGELATHFTEAGVPVKQAAKV